MSDRRVTHAHVFWLGVAANVFAGVLGLLVLGWWRARTGRELTADIADLAGDGQRRR